MFPQFNVIAQENRIKNIVFPKEKPYFLIFMRTATMMPKRRVTPTTTAATIAPAPGYTVILV